MNKIKLDVSSLHDAKLEPVILKLAHGGTEGEAETVPATTINGDALPNIMWLLAVSLVFILVLIILVSYFVVNRANDDNGRYYEEEDYGEL